MEVWMFKWLGTQNRNIELKRNFDYLCIFKNLLIYFDAGDKLFHIQGGNWTDCSIVCTVICYHPYACSGYKNTNIPAETVFHAVKRAPEEWFCIVVV